MVAFASFPKGQTQGFVLLAPPESKFSTTDENDMETDVYEDEDGRGL
jgi:hypothetical protein